ncbi:MAG: diguanylate cyclase [Proteobacteria bacterium]|nr:diguanylate cyclase [Pseudomonadota bacterium]
MACVLAGIGGAAVAGLAFDGWAAYFYAILTGMPLAFGLWLAGSNTSKTLAVLTVLYSGYLLVVAKRRERQFAHLVIWREDALQNAKNLRRLAAFNAMRSQVNIVIATAENEKELFQAICDLAIQYGGFQLAWIGRPNATGRFEFVAFSGESAYLDGLYITTDTSVPEGRGPTPRTWFESRACFSGSFVTAPALQPWVEKAKRFGLNSTATLPIQRLGRTSDVFVVYHSEMDAFDAEMRSLLEDIATDLSRGLARLASRQRELKLGAQLDAAQRFERSLFQKNAAGLYLIDAHRTILDVNPALCAMTGYESSELIGLTTAALHVDVDAYDDWEHRYIASMDGSTIDHEAVPFRRKDGSRGSAKLMTASVELPDGSPGVLVSAIDISALQQANEAMSYQARHDALTGLLNRFALELLLPISVVRGRQQNSVFAVGMIDLDDFKFINDTWGHDAGDRLLQDFAARLKAHTRGSDIVARLGGDEFVIVTENIDELQAIDQLHDIFDLLHQCVETPFEICPDVFQTMGMTMGVALFPLDAEDGDALLRQADAAMYQAKLHKHDRKHWWRIGGNPDSDAGREEELDPYGLDAAALLESMQPQIKALTDKFVDDFFANLSQTTNPWNILKQLSSTEADNLRRVQTQHFLFLFSPNTSVLSRK